MKVQHIFLVPVPVLLIGSILFNHDIEYATTTGSVQTSLMTLMIWISLILLFSSAGYYLFKSQKLNKILVNLHIWPTLIGLAYFSAYAMGYLDKEASDVLAISILLVGTGITCYLINMTVSVVSTLLGS